MSVDGARLTLARRTPVRWDVAVQTVLTGCADRNRAAIAHQVRQDIWRALGGSMLLSVSFPAQRDVLF